MREGPEAELYPVLLAEYPESRFGRLFEVPFGRKRIDFVAIPKQVNEGWIVAVEFKFRDWKKALWQARLNASIVHRSFVALDACAIPPLKSQPLFERAGVGLIAIDTELSSLDIVISPQARRRRLCSDDVWRIWSTPRGK